MKKISITLIICLVSVLAKAQLGFNYAQYDLGISGTFNRAYTDAETIKSTHSANLHFTYNYTPYLNYIAEVQLGKLAGGDSVNTLSGRQFNNHYVSVTFRAQLQAGEIMDYSNSRFLNALKSLYVSSGVGVIYNNMHDIHRSSLYIDGYTTTGLNTSSELLIPAKIGYEFKLYNSYNEPAIKLDIGYQYNFIMGDQLDGMKVGVRNDGFGQFVIGLKFGVGGITSYRKDIPYMQ
ncbi:hypothetical protein HH214_04595 [Mucilaginibacter robiniae]|uniref:Outer membrane protein beta-barrel domain-containing protein n=1 Tax=Mucilaginibacter robiniae TaxID=2728022 RepID=A0A7L5DYL8_9SPHI|nr:hypothetical protein [Mucilaginibacter robiniae]QJD95207.1 hypothetical protein HH214_04595 [Mucilaginibacter robiniae]